MMLPIETGRHNNNTTLAQEEEAIKLDILYLLDLQTQKARLELLISNKIVIMLEQI
jgi:hypothetical protein